MKKVNNRNDISSKMNRYTKNSDNYAQTLYPWCNGNTTENKWREYTLEESGLNDKKM